MYAYLPSVSCNLTNTINLNYIISRIYYNQKPSILLISYRDSYHNRLGGHYVVADASYRHVQTTETFYKTPKLIPIDPPFPPDAFIGDDPQMEFEYYSEIEVIEEKFIGINWGWDGSFMYSGSSPIWFSADVISWSVGSTTYTVIDSVITDFSIIH